MVSGTHYIVHDVNRLSFMPIPLNAKISSPWYTSYIPKIDGFMQNIATQQKRQQDDDNNEAHFLSASCVHELVYINKIGTKIFVLIL